MKKITKLFITSATAVALFLVSSESVKAQTDSQAWRLGLGLSAGIPTNDAYNFAIGGDVRLQKDFTENISGILSVGYNSFTAKNNFPSADFIPVKAGAKFFVAESVYLSGELGAGIGTKSGSGTSFLYAPGVGYASNSGLDLSLRYEGASNNGFTLGQVALRLAYGFRL